MNRPLRILHLEDDPEYSSLVRSLLEADGIEVDMSLVMRRQDFEAALEHQSFDIVLADFFLPDYNGLDALAAVRERLPNMPFLLVSGTIAEATAIESLKSGATDYVLKLCPDKLVPTIRRAMAEAEERARRVQVETELARQEEYFRTVTENILDILLILDPHGRILYNSPSVHCVLGLNPEVVVGDDAFKYVHPDELAKVQQALAHLLQGPEPVAKLEFRARHADGSFRVLEAIARNHTIDGGLNGIVVSARDITDRKAAEANLREREMLFHSVWENSVDGMRLTDAGGLTVAVNSAFCRIVGMPREELENHPYTVIYSLDEQPERLLEAYRERFRARRIDGAVERRVVLRGGGVITLEERASYVELPGREPLLFSVLRDITAQKRLEDQFRHAQKMEAIGQLAGGVAHDFNNILTVIHGHGSLLTAADNLPDPAARSAEQIVQAAERAAGLTRQLLTFSRRQVLQTRRLDLNEIVANLTKMLGRILGEDIALQLNYSPQPAYVDADAGMIEQVLMNLAVNSRDAMPSGGVLNIRVAHREIHQHELHVDPEAIAGQFVCLSVTDAGCGIPRQNMRRLFEPFFTTKEVGKGTGLGLATVYGIVKQHQGWVQVESEVGKGTVFRVFLPQAAPVSTMANEAAPAACVRGGEETILVVEDEEPVRELVCHLLSGQGYEILQAESGPKALEVWHERKQDIDLLLTDLVMPDKMNGRELAERLWAERPELKVVFTSGYSAEVVGQDFDGRGGLQYLQKPYHPIKLASVVRGCLDA